MAKRKSTGKRQRFNIFKRDKFTCQYCGGTPPAVVLVLDHVIPVSAGGETIEENLVTSCEACNQGKAANPLSDVPRPITDTLKEQVERREQLEEYNQFLLESHQRERDAAADIGTYWFDQICPRGQVGKHTFGSARMQSVRTFLKRLTAAEIYDSIDAAFAKVTNARFEYDEKAWKYFCGICWNKIHEREDSQS